MIISDQWSVIGRKSAAAALLAGLCAAAGPARAQRLSGPDEVIVKQVRLEQRLDSQAPLDAPFADETGKPVKLGDYFGEKPVMLMLIQYRCQMLCTEEINVLLDSLKRMEFTPGNEFNLLIVSIDPRETADLAAGKKQAFMAEYRKPAAAPGVHFLTGGRNSIDRLSEAVGFHYAYVQKTDQFAHPDGVIIATPHGKVARYFFRLEYPPRFLRYGLVEAANNRISLPLIDAIALLCFHYNPDTGRYSIAYMNVLRAAGLGTVLMIALSIMVMKVRERHKPAPPGTV